MAIPGYKGDQTTPIAATFRDILRVPILNGQLIAGVMPAGATTYAFAHALYRAYQGGVIMGGDPGSSSLSIALPTTASLTVDITRLAVIQSPTTLATNTAFLVWLF